MMVDANVLVTFGDAVHAKRMLLGISQETLAERSGLDRTYISSVERGKRNVSLVNICKLSHALGVSPADLLENIGGCRE